MRVRVVFFEDIMFELRFERRAGIGGGWCWGDVKGEKRRGYLGVGWSTCYGFVRRLISVF